MPTTSNFGWTTPADTDLVKDGAAAIRTLGNGIDTSLVDLKGGTTGQYLVKQSNTDLDFTWTTNTADIDGITATSPLTGGGTSGTITVGIQDGTTAQKGAVQLTDSISSTSTTTAATPNSVKTAYDLANGAIAKSLVDAKADLITATADNTPARLAVGNNGETLVADSSATTGLRWSAGNAIGNPVVNSAMQIWQRGTSFSLAASTSYASGYTADRWTTQTNTGQASTISRQLTGDTTNLPNIQYAMRYQRNSGQTGTGTQYLVNSFETINTIPFVGKTVTVSYYARAGANYSPTNGAFIGSIFTGTGTDQNAFSYTGSSQIGATSVALTTTWQRFSFTVAIPNTVTEMAPTFQWSPTGTAGAADYFELTGVQIDVGSVALPFRTYSATLAGELAACQRYLPAITTTAAAEIGTGFNISTTQPFVTIPFQVPARVAPTGITATAANYAARDATGTTKTLTAIAFNNASPVACAILGTVASGLVAGNGTSLQLNGTILFTGCEL